MNKTQTTTKDILHCMWQVKLPDSLLSGIVDSKEGYQLRPVSGSNLFLILKQRRLHDEESCCNSEVHQTRVVVSIVNYYLFKKRNTASFDDLMYLSRSINLSSLSLYFFLLSLSLYVWAKDTCSFNRIHNE